ncbi:hypothetical protein Q5O24_11475 [Eubacteriaceae bacterium ES3]|nr:hypothetical protein Q5O24_11475 [Eubacteriaceae bacterium ES3]
MAITKENLSSKLSIRSNFGNVDGKDMGHRGTVPLCYLYLFYMLTQ